MVARCYEARVARARTHGLVLREHGPGIHHHLTSSSQASIIACPVAAQESPSSVALPQCAAAAVLCAVIPPRVAIDESGGLI